MKIMQAKESILYVLQGMKQGILLGEKSLKMKK